MYPINPERDHLVVSKLSNRFGSAIESHEVLSDMLCITAQKELIPSIFLFLRDDLELQYNFLTTLCGMHYPETEQLGVVYHVQSFVNNHRIRIKTVTELKEPNIPTITTIWPAANWMEREAYDFFGILFEGHPNLKRILNMDEMTGFPLRKEFPLEDQTREDKNDSMFGR
ncbi:NADH-ubiquinone oxidoreductase chain C [Aquipluma nitroreducens]|uniref:NADH-quinone oxidoreductase subunit C n=1 Tax=Aquipluma nitroreducens TaxID=2010828 RepID=A0A5K7S4X5_9BACT|nr:NADH-quinone oxidoreductase subunit C [Aquipluma nitroreducens]BBE16593.1 NADH-ubiquinone oxidoreductase chain C [Aquipluma nitroreducens]